MALFYDAAMAVLQHGSAAARAEAMRIDVLPSPTVWPLCANLIMLWYQGFWPALPASWYPGTGSPPPKGWSATQKIVPSAQAYTAQLAYRAAGAHPPGANPTGHGSWSIDPVFGDDVGCGSSDPPAAKERAHERAALRRGDRRRRRGWRAGRARAVAGGPVGADPRGGHRRRDEPGHLPPVPADALHRGRRPRDAERSVSLERCGAVARHPERPRASTTSTTRRCSS